MNAHFDCLYDDSVFVVLGWGRQINSWKDCRLCETDVSKDGRILKEVLDVIFGQTIFNQFYINRFALGIPCLRGK